MSNQRQDKRLLQRLAHLSNKARRKPRKLTDEELTDLPRLYRAAASITSRLVTRGDQPAAIRESKRVLAEAHAQIHSGIRASRRPWFSRFASAAFIDGPRAIRSEWRIFTLWMVLFYGLAILSYVLVKDDMSLAFRLADPASTAGAIEQLDGLAEGEAWQGNFTFDFEESDMVSGLIMGNNLAVTLLWMSTGILPPLLAYLLANFALGIGAYVGLASHWGQSASIFGILMCHGTFELTAVILCGSAGTVISRAVFAPGGFSRRHALRLAGNRALGLMAPVVPLLIAAGLIEGYVSPHVSTAMRLTVAVSSAAVMIAWFGWVGRDQASAAETSRRAPELGSGAHVL